MDAVHTSYRLLTEGWLPVWGGGVALLALAWVVVRHHRREFAHVRPSRLVRWVLPALRVAIVGLAVWLVCRPAVQIVTRWHQRPRLAVLTDASRSMTTAEGFAALHQKIDILAMLESTPLKGRNRFGSDLSRALRPLARLLTQTADDLTRDLAAVDTGLPLDPGTAPQIRWFGRALSAEIDKASALPGAPALETKDREFREKLAWVTGRWGAVRATARALGGDADITAQEAARRPQILGRFVRRLRQTIEAVAALRTGAGQFQDLLDKALLEPSVLAAFAKRQVTRDRLAQLAAKRIGDRCARHFQVNLARCDGLETCLTHAFHQQVATPLGAVVVLSDGSSGLIGAVRAAADNLTGMGVPVHTVLVGADGAEPADVGLVGVDLWGVAVRNDEATVRVLVKNHLARTRKARLDVRVGKRVLATTPISPGRRGYRVLDVPLILPQVGRHQLVFQAVTDGPDAYPGNQRCVRTVDVLPDRARVLLVCDRVSDEFAACRQALDNLPFVELTAMVSAPEISELEVGAVAGAFPGRADHWKGITLAVLLGRVPDELRKGKPDGGPAPAVAGLKQAVENGLHVYVQDLGDSSGREAWTDVLGLTTQAVGSPQALQLEPGLWPALYQLGRDEVESRARWGVLPPARMVRVCPGEGFPVLGCAAGPVVSLVVRGRGLVVHNGIADLASLRGDQTSPCVNRLLAGLLVLALRPLHASTGKAAPRVLFPAQPIHGKRVFVIGKDAGPAEGSGLRATPDAGDRSRGIPATAYVVTDPQRVAVEAAGVRVQRLVHRALERADLDLTPRSGPLAAISNETGARHVTLVDAPDAVPVTPPPPPRELRQARTHRLWHGWWPLPLLVLLVSAEYLLRRRAGRVM